MLNQVQHDSKQKGQSKMIMNKRDRVICVFLTGLMLFIGCTKKQTVTEEQKQEYPKKIISLSPAATEVLFALGAEKQIAAVSDFSDYPPEADALPKVGGFDGKSLSIEKILSFEPDFVYLTSGMHDFLIPSLQEFGIQYYVSNANSINAVTKEICDIGMLTGHFKEASEISLDIKAQMISAKNKVSNKNQKVYYEVWNAPYMTAGQDSFITDIIEAAGANNPFALIPEPYPMLSEESLIATAPNVILIPASNGTTVDEVKNRNGWSAIPAVANNKVYIVDDNLFSRPGPRVGQAVQELADLLK